ncbi:hypothetical protein Pflav_040750 [Phytohabitans flavus]|uniref:Uncharacterized protein n=1 Tax=Phytohabitans flavus TaxID=1076124 RepID=A0A6F8XV10_9ACTN|nr:hypothetical protein Pflav_040750 [Phytohabitans flavus]
MGVQRQSRPYELWSAPLDGWTPARLVATWPLAGPAYPIGLQDEVVYWRYAGDEEAVPGIYEMSLGDRVTSLVPGSEGYQDFGAFPWVSSTRPVGADFAGPVRPERSGDLLNVVTGTRRAWTAHEGTEMVDCNPVLCLGLDRNGGATVQELDGSGFRQIPYSQRRVPYEQAAFAGRFGIGAFTESGGRTWVWDRTTGAAATMVSVSLPKAVRMPQTVVEWQEPNGAKYVLDLAAIK